jgi:hypothetical protein
VNRRDFAKGLAASRLLTQAAHAQAQSLPGTAHNTRSLPKEMRADVVVIGGSTGGCAAALAALRNGCRVIMTEETDWIGGQFTAILLAAPDEHPWTESFGRTAAYAEFRNRVRDYYRRNYPLTAQARARLHLNPGDAQVSRGLRFEPPVALAVFYEMLAPYISAGALNILLNHKPVAADIHGDAVQAVNVRDLNSGDVTTLRAPYFLDATDKGELIYLSKTEYVIGFESQKETGELHAPREAQPLNHLSITMGFPVDYVPGEDHTIEKPEEYGFWRDYVPNTTPPWPGKLFSLTTPNNITLQPEHPYLDPEEPRRSIAIGELGGKYNLWYGRVMLDRENFLPGTYVSSVVLVHGGRWRQMDYWLGNVVEVPEEEALRNVKRAKQQSLSFLYWLQTECPRPDGGAGWKGLRLRRNLAGTEDGLAKYPYVREGRRIKAEFTVTERHIGTDQRMKETGLDRDHVTAEHFRDSVGVGSYRIDLHPSTGGNNYIDISSLPFEIPLGALIPQRVTNLIPACKNIGSTHLSNGAFHMHPVEWTIGEAAALLAAYCANKKIQPKQVRNDESVLADFQRYILNQGIEIRWPNIGPR